MYADAQGCPVDMRGRRFHVNALEPAGAGNLRKPFCVVDITLVHAGREHAFGVARANTLNGDTAFGKAMVEECRQGSCLEHYSPQLRAMPSKPRGENFRIARNDIASQHLPLAIDHADMRRLVTHIQPCINRHRLPSCFEAPARLRTIQEDS